MRDLEIALLSPRFSDFRTNGMCRLIKNHHLRDKNIHGPRLPKVAGPRDFAEVLFEVACVIRVVKVRENFEKAVVVRFVTALK